MDKSERDQFIKDLNGEYEGKKLLLKEMIKIFSAITGTDYNSTINKDRSAYHTIEKFMITPNDILYIDYEFTSTYDEDFITKPLDELIKITDMKIEDF